MFICKPHYVDLTHPSTSLWFNTPYCEVVSVSGQAPMCKYFDASNCRNAHGEGMSSPLYCFLTVAVDLVATSKL
eukprot:scaffold13221_cov123-Skeletonema_dohrnii-CCMP3373.AAC.2